MEGDLIKLGRVKFRVREICLTGKEKMKSIIDKQSNNNLD